MDPALLFASLAVVLALCLLVPLVLRPMYRRSARVRRFLAWARLVNPDAPERGLIVLTLAFVQTALLVMITTMLIALEWMDPHRDVYLPVLRWLDGFAHSPGLGGLAAVAAASIAFGQWRRQREVERKTRRDQQWWDAYKLIYAEVMKDTVRALPETLALLDTLARESDTEVQNAAADALIEELLRRN